MREIPLMQQEKASHTSPAAANDAAERLVSSEPSPGPGFTAKGGGSGFVDDLGNEPGPGYVTAKRCLTIGTFDNYCEAVAGGARWVITCTWPARPEATYLEQFRGLPKWFVLRWTAFVTCRQLEELAAAAIADARARPRYDVQAMRAGELNEVRGTTGAAG